MKSPQRTVRSRDTPSWPITVSWSTALLWSVIVFVIAVLLRLPSCYESFWVDELHTAWTIWDGLEQVAGRAAMGHQTPFYFWILWGWRQVFGDSEIVLRLSSVFAVALASGVLVTGLARVTNAVSAGVAAGMVLAVDVNSLFFGTELRPYAFVLLLASLAVVCFVELWTPSRSAINGLLLVAACLLATLLQPTAAGVLVWLPLAWGAHACKRDPRAALRPTPAKAAVLAAVGLTGLTIWILTLGESWADRHVWASFATARSWRQLLTAWSWKWLMLVPLAAAWAVVLVRRWYRDSERAGKWEKLHAMFSLAVLLSLLATGSTVLYWWIAWTEFLPIWHRRYFVAVLPILAALVGCCCAVVAASPSLASSRPEQSWRGWALGAFVVSGLMWQQGTLAKLKRGLRQGVPVALVTRNENWRAAGDWLRERSSPAQRIAVDARLIEWGAIMSENVIADRDRAAVGLDPRRYLCYPLLGPYQVTASVEPISAELAARLGTVLGAASPCLSTDRPDWIISRTAPDRLMAWIRKTSGSGDRIARHDLKVHCFDGICILRVPPCAEAPGAFRPQDGRL